jgi:hypothetical protein
LKYQPSAFCYADIHILRYFHGLLILLIEIICHPSFFYHSGCGRISNNAVRWASPISLLLEAIFRLLHLPLPVGSSTHPSPAFILRQAPQNLICFLPTLTRLWHAKADDGWMDGWLNGCLGAGLLPL